MTHLLCLLVVWLVYAAKCQHYPRVQQYAVTGDTGEPLFLTPLIEAGSTLEAQLAATVIPLLPGVPSYSGYLTVNKRLGSNLFFWYFPAQKQSALTSTLLWLQGGPGASSLFGLFTENGPFSVEGSELQRRAYSWNRNHNVLYVDNPVGAGYSFTEHDEGYPTNETAVGEDLYSALIQFFKLFPELQKTNFIVTGESYAGHYIPAIAYTIHKNNPTADLKINLRGLFIGNGWIDPETQLGYGDYLYQLGLIDSNVQREFNNIRDLAVKFIKSGRWLEARNYINRLVWGDGSGTLFSNNTGLRQFYDYTDERPPGNDTDSYVYFVQQTETRRALHVGPLPYNDGAKARRHLWEDTAQSVKPWMEELLEHYAILLYNGQWDVICAYPMMASFMDSLQWSGSEAYRTAARSPWYAAGQVAGYSKTAGLLTEVLVRNAGHMVPTQQPLWAFRLLSSFVRSASLKRPSEL